jgi:hypothetical protein
MKAFLPVRLPAALGLRSSLLFRLPYDAADGASPFPAAPHVQLAEKVLHGGLGTVVGLPIGRAGDLSRATPVQGVDGGTEESRGVNRCDEGFRDRAGHGLTDAGGINASRTRQRIEVKWFEPGKLA